MRALVFGGPLTLQVEDRPIPEPGPGEVRLRVRAVGICGSDLHGYTGDTGRRAPGQIMGHEIGAVVEASDEGPPAGTVATVHPVLFCGECRMCRDGETSLCERRQVIGVTPTLQGGYADYICVPARNVVPVPAASVEHAALVEPLAVALHAARRGGVAPGADVLVTGAGTIGIACLLAARRDGAGRVFVSEPLAARRALAAELGATVIDPGTDDVVELVREGTGGGVDVALDAVGISSTVNAATAATRPGGAVVLVGMGRPRIDLDLFAVVVEERRLIGTFCYSERHFLETAEWVASGTLDLERVIQRRAGFDDVIPLFHRLAVGEDDATKALLVTDMPGEAGGGAPA
jgi:2-desacetyl-2-hydroxyethyl bacteriochlorophyllide A dehydrogenase